MLLIPQQLLVESRMKLLKSRMKQKQRQNEPHQRHIAKGKAGS